VKEGRAAPVPFLVKTCGIGPLTVEFGCHFDSEGQHPLIGTPRLSLAAEQGAAVNDAAGQPREGRRAASQFPSQVAKSFALWLAYPLQSNQSSFGSSMD